MIPLRIVEKKNKTQTIQSLKQQIPGTASQAKEGVKEQYRLHVMVRVVQSTTNNQR